MVLLFLGFYANAWKVADQTWFAKFQRDSESLVLGRMVKSRQDGIFSAGGLLGRGLSEHTAAQYHFVKNNREALIEYQYTAYLHGENVAEFATYKSQGGGQALFLSVVDKIVHQPPAIKLACFYMLNSLLAACTLTFIVYWFYREFDRITAVWVLATMLISQWLTVFGRNLFWMLWAFYLPMIMVLYFLRRHRHRAATRSYAFTFISMVFTGMLLKVIFNGYEYITTTLIMLAVPLVFYCAADSRGTYWIVRHALLSGCAAGGATLLSMALLCVQISCAAGGLLSGAHHILFVLKKRTHADPLGFPPEYAASLQASASEVLSKYLKGTFFDLTSYVSSHNAFIDRYLFNIRFGYLVIIFIIATLFILAQKKKQQQSSGWSKSMALVIATCFPCWRRYHGILFSKRILIYIRT